MDAYFFRYGHSDTDFFRFIVYVVGYEYDEIQQLLYEDEETAGPAR